MASAQPKRAATTRSHNARAELSPVSKAVSREPVQRRSEGRKKATTTQQLSHPESREDLPGPIAPPASSTSSLDQPEGLVRMFHTFSITPAPQHTGSNSSSEAGFEDFSKVLASIPEEAGTPSSQPSTAPSTRLPLPSPPRQLSMAPQGYQPPFTAGVQTQLQVSNVSQLPRHPLSSLHSSRPSVAPSQPPHPPTPSHQLSVTPHQPQPSLTTTHQSCHPSSLPQWPQVSTAPNQLSTAMHNPALIAPHQPQASMAPQNPLPPQQQLPTQLQPSTTPRRSSTLPHQSPLTPRANASRVPRNVIPAHQTSRGHRITPKRRVGSGREGAKDVWEFFELKDKKRTCFFCLRDAKAGRTSKLVAYDEGSSSSTLRAHLIKYHAEEWIGACDHKKISITAHAAEEAVRNYWKKRGGTAPQFDKGKTTRKPFTQEGFEDAIIDFIVADDQSLKVIECLELRAIFLMLREELQDSDIPHRATVRRRIMQLLEEQLNTLAEEMKDALGKISFTTDIWTSQNMVPYMAITAHWIQFVRVEHVSGPPTEELVLCADLVGFHHLPGHHTGKHMAQLFLFVTDCICITSRIGWVTMDNASNNDTFMVHLETTLHSRNIPFDKVQRRVRCFPHVINLACQAIVKAITRMEYITDEGDAQFIPSSSTAQSFLEALHHDPVAHIRALVRACRASALRREYFRECVLVDQRIDYQLLRDVETRWSSTLLMIERALLLRKAIERFVSHEDFTELAKFKLSEADWDALARFKDILEKPHAFQQKLSAEATPTLQDAIPSFEKLIQVWKKHQQHHLETAGIVAAGLEKIEAYSARADCIDAYMLTMCVNPEMKLNWYRKHRPFNVPSIKANILSHLKSYMPASPAMAAAAQLHPSHNLAPSWADEALDSDSNDDNWSLDLDVSAESYASLDEEFERYLNDTQTNHNSLQYWQQNRRRFPTLFHLAMDILPIQGSAVPCERVFSSGAETDTAQRSRMTPALMEALQILKFALKKRRLNFTEGTSKEAEVRMLEEVDSRPEDVDSFTRELHELLETV